MRRLLTATLLSLIALGSCLPREPAGVDGRAVQTTLFIRAALTGTTVATVVVEVTAPDIPTPLVFNIRTVNGVAAGAISVPSGSNRTITLNAYDAGGVETHTGSVTVSIQPGANPAISIVLTPLTGNVPITVTLGSFSVTVGPAAATLAPGDTVRLTATVLDANSNPVTGQVAWATLSPLVATVVSTGQQTGRVTAAGLGQTTVIAVYAGIAGPAAITVTQPGFGGPLRVSPVNPRYFTDGGGRAIYLTGAHTWPSFQDVGLTDPPAAFNWTGFLDFLQGHHLNFMLLYRWEQAKWSAEIPNDLWLDPTAYLRPGPGTALDGKPKFNLIQFNPAYFARMRQRVIEAGRHGVYVAIMLFNGWSIDDKQLGIGNPWRGHPFHRDNNINGIDGDPDRDGFGTETHTLQTPAVTALQEAYARHVVDAVNDLDNVLYEISNESPGGSEAWEEHMIEYIKGYEAGKPKQHPVGMSALWRNGNNADLFASSADWIAPNGPTGDPLVADGRKVIINDTDHLCGICIDESWVWKSFTRGLNPVLMDPFDGAYPPTAGHYNLSDPGWELVRTNLGYTLTYATRLNLVAMQPRGDLASTGYCLANAVAQGAAYLVYLPTGGTVTVDLSAASGSLTIEWFDPSTGQTTAGGTTPAGAVLPFTAPMSGDAVLYIHQ
jgi:collagenase-like protein with putative collagen-binding domain/uncharacterized protein DUF6298/Big-like domain-containing protein